MNNDNVLLLLEAKKEFLAKRVHDAWMKEKASQGFHDPTTCTMKSVHAGCEKCHADMIPYEDLAENIKDYDRVTVTTVIDAIEEIL